MGIFDPPLPQYTLWRHCYYKTAFTTYSLGRPPSPIGAYILYGWPLHQNAGKSSFFISNRIFVIVEARLASIEITIKLTIRQVDFDQKFLSCVAKEYLVCLMLWLLKLIVKVQLFYGKSWILNHSCLRQSAKHSAQTNMHNEVHWKWAKSPQYL